MKDLPDVGRWQPNSDKSDSFRKILFDKCKYLESELVSKLKYQKSLNVSNFDSGLEAEKLIVATLKTLLPKRYKIAKGLLSDRYGKTSGEHDIVIFNEIWFPHLIGNYTGKQKSYFPIEGVYAVGEVKQSLNIDSLDDGLKKLVLAQRLYRPQVGVNRFTENRKKGDVDLGTLNPLFTFLIAYSRDSKTKVKAIFERFFQINKKLQRQEMIRCLCVLHDFTILWASLNESTNQYDMALFTSKDEELPVIPIMQYGNKESESSLYNLLFYLGAHLNGSILGSEDIYVAYGNDNSKWEFPEGDEYDVENY